MCVLCVFLNDWDDFSQLAGRLQAALRCVRHAEGSCFWTLSDRGFEFFALGAGGIKVFGALGCVVVLGVRDFHCRTPGGQDFGRGVPKN